MPITITAEDVGKTLTQVVASRGGNARTRSLTREQRVAIAKKAAATRWAKNRARQVT